MGMPSGWLNIATTGNSTIEFLNNGLKMTCATNWGGGVRLFISKNIYNNLIENNWACKILYVPSLLNSSTTTSYAQELDLFRELKGIAFWVNVGGDDKGSVYYKKNTNSNTRLSSIDNSTKEFVLTVNNTNKNFNLYMDGVLIKSDSFDEYNSNTIDWVLSYLQAGKSCYEIIESVDIIFFCNVNYYNGSTLLYSETVGVGKNGTYVGSTPTKASDAQYSYTFSGWSNGTDDNTVDNDALTNIIADRNVYACFTSTLRKYTITFVKASDDGGGTLQTINNVDYGTTITAASSYTGSTPTTTKGSATDYPFKGWDPASATVTGNTTFTAKFGSPVEVVEISDTWDQIIAKIDNGTYKTAYKLGNYKPLDLGTEGTINMQIVGIDTDELADGSGYAPLTFIGM